MSTSDPYRQPKRAMIASAVVAVAFIGFWVGIRQRPSSAHYQSFAEEESPGNAPTARSNEELSTNPWRVGVSDWTPIKSVANGAITTKDEAAYIQAMNKRQLNRSFEGAPPTIPHPVGQGSAKECLLCHLSGATIGETSAPIMSHTRFTVCTQCHVPSSGPLPQSLGQKSFLPMVESSFVGNSEAPAPWKMASGSPPRQPHSTFMRENCQSCHGQFGRPGLQTSHPERQSCQQCHVPPAAIEQRGVQIND